MSGLGCQSDKPARGSCEMVKCNTFTKFFDLTKLAFAICVRRLLANAKCDRLILYPHQCSVIPSDLKLDWEPEGFGESLLKFDTHPC